MRPIEQIINEGNAIIQAKDNEIKTKAWHINTLDEIIAERNHKIGVQNKKIIENLSYQTRLTEQIENMQNTIDTCRELNEELLKENLNLWTSFIVMGVVLVLALISFI